MSALSCIAVLYKVGTWPRFSKYPAKGRTKPVELGLLRLSYRLPRLISASYFIDNARLRSMHAAFPCLSRTDNLFSIFALFRPSLIAGSWPNGANEGYPDIIILGVGLWHLFVRQCITLASEHSVSRHPPVAGGSRQDRGGHSRGLPNRRTGCSTSNPSES
jgi:hypothetical protein